MSEYKTLIRQRQCRPLDASEERALADARQEEVVRRFYAARTLPFRRFREAISGAVTKVLNPLAGWLAERAK